MPPRPSVLAPQFPNFRGSGVRAIQEALVQTGAAGAAASIRYSCVTIVQDAADLRPEPSRAGRPSTPVGSDAATDAAVDGVGSLGGELAAALWAGKLMHVTCM